MLHNRLIILKNWKPPNVYQVSSNEYNRYYAAAMNGDTQSKQSHRIFKIIRFSQIIPLHFCPLLVPQLAMILSNLLCVLQTLVSSHFFLILGSGDKHTYFTENSGAKPWELP